jgi:hypothetical protein
MVIAGKKTIMTSPKATALMPKIFLLLKSRHRNKPPIISIVPSIIVKKQ